MLKNEDFLNIEDYLEDEYWVTCFITQRGQGKTYSGFQLVNKHIENDKKVALTRLNMESFKTFKDDITSIFPDWKVSLNAKNIKKDNKTIAFLTSLSSYANTKGAQAPDVDLMLFDEFNEDVYIENAYSKWVMMVDTFKRHKPNFKCILLGNPICKNNWFLNAMGVKISFDNETTQVYKLPQYKVKIVVTGTKDFQALNKARQSINSLASADPNAHAFYNEGEFLNDESEDVLNFNVFVKATFNPLFCFRYGDFKYIFGLFLGEKGEKLFFVDRFSVFHKEYRNLREFSFDEFGNTSKTASILDEDDIDDFQISFFKAAKSGRLMYGSFEALEDLKRFIAFGSML